MVYARDLRFLFSSWRRYWCPGALAVALVLSLWTGFGLGNDQAMAANTQAPVVSVALATERLQAIAEEMKQIHFCNRSTCRFRDIR